jgi:short-subunit dehydrogenase
MQTPKNIVVFGATSAIVHAVLKLYAQQKCNFYLIARNLDKLAVVTQDLTARGGSIMANEAYDFNDYDQLNASLTNANTILTSIDMVLVGHGELPEQQQLEIDSTELVTSINTNYTSVAVIALTAARLLAQQDSGTLAIISSVAGDRGRKSNYIYGSTKSGINILIEGLQGRFSGSRVNVVNIKPGMIDTPMTSSMEKGGIWTTPEKIAGKIVTGISKEKDCIYVPGVWRLIMLIIKILPARILQKLNI